MRICCRVAALTLWLSVIGLAAPPLTTIEDVLYKADGSKFNGVAFVEWKSFQAADFSNIATHSVTVQIQNGVLRVQLVPTTNASAGAYYSVRYNSDGRIQFDEIWAVPPSTATLKLKDVRALTGTPGGQVIPPAPDTQIEESDVVGLVDDLAARPLAGPGYAPMRAAYINETGALEAVLGDLADCVRVDGTAGPCDAALSPGPGFVDGEAPAGLIDGSNAVFTLGAAPTPAGSLHVYRNGILQKAGMDYTLADNVVTFTLVSVPQAGDTLLCSYRLAGPSEPPVGAGIQTGQPQVLCSSTGTSTNSTSLTQLGSCTIPAGMLSAGDRVEVRFSYAHPGVAAGFTYELHWGATTITSRAAGAGDHYIGGHADAGVHSGGAQYDVQSWGNSLVLGGGTGNASDSLGSALVVGFLGRMATSTSETVTLNNFTVIRYPAVLNP